MVRLNSGIVKSEPGSSSTTSSGGSALPSKAAIKNEPSKVAPRKEAAIASEIANNRSAVNSNEGLQLIIAELETRNKEQEARIKEQEARIKEQEARIKEQEAMIKELEAKHTFLENRADVLEFEVGELKAKGMFGPTENTHQSEPGNTMYIDEITAIIREEHEYEMEKLREKHEHDKAKMKHKFEKRLNDIISKGKLASDHIKYINEFFDYLKNMKALDD